MRTKKTLLVAALLALAGGAVAAQDLTIRWGTEAGYRPFMFKEADGSLQGFDHDIGEAICAELQAQCTWVEQDWDGIIPGLLAGRYDAILASMTVTEDRQRVVDFTIPYYTVPERLVGREDAGLDDGEGLAGKTVGVLRGTTHATYLLAERKDVILREYPTQEEVWLDLAAGRIDAAFASQIVVNDGFLKTDAGKGYAMFGQEYMGPPYFGTGHGIALRKEDAELRDKINAALRAIHENGTYAEISAKYFDFDIWPH